MAHCGLACKAKAQAGTHLCYFHDPARREQRLEGQRRGGHGRTQHVLSTTSLPDDLGFDDRRAIVRTLAYTAKTVLGGQTDPKASNTIAYLADCALRALQSDADVERIERLERQQQAESNVPVDQADYSMTQFDDEGELVRPAQDGDECDPTLDARIQRILDQSIDKGVVDAGQDAAQKPDRSKKEDE